MSPGLRDQEEASPLNCIPSLYAEVSGAVTRKIGFVSRSEESHTEVNGPKAAGRRLGAEMEATETRLGRGEEGR